jgi:environmental stress-induced protein Ves
MKIDVKLAAPVISDTSARGIQIIQAEQMAAQAWRNGGGQTRELLTWPSAAEWKLRISRADIECDGPFSAFDGVQRWFVVLCGHGVVLNMPTADGHTLDYHLLPGHAPLQFEGGLAPACHLLDGATQDLNLMARGGKACMQAVEVDQPWPATFAMCGLYTACSGVWSGGRSGAEGDDLQTIRLPAHSLLWIADTRAWPHADYRFAAHATEPTRAWWLGYTPDATP